MSTSPEETLAHYWQWCDQEQREPAKVWGLRDETGKLIAWSTKQGDLRSMKERQDHAKTGKKWTLAVEIRRTP